MRTVKFVFLPLIWAVVFPTICSAQTRTSPDAAVRNYVNALVTGNFAGFWSHSEAYNNDVRVQTSNLPKVMWPQKIEAIRGSWEQSIRKARSEPAINTCWGLFRPGAKLEFLETRDWKSFVRVSYADGPEAPTIFRGQQLRRLGRGIVIVNVKPSQPGQHALISDLNEICQLTEGFSWYAPPPLSKDVALTLAKAALPDGDQPRITLTQYGPAWNGRDHQAAERLKDLLTKSGITVVNPHVRDGYYQVDEVRPPESWGQYMLKSQFSAMGRTPLPTYALAESVRYDVTRLVGNGEGRMSGSLTLLYEGCTPICGLLKEFHALGQNVDGSRVFFSYAGQDWYGRDWPKGQVKEIYFGWNADEGWKLTGVGRSQ